MPVKSLRFLGKVISDTVSLTVNMGNHTVFDGTITAADSNSLMTLFRTEIPAEFLTSIPMSVLVSNGSVVMTQILINQQLVSNNRFSMFQLTLLHDATEWEEKLNIMIKIADPPFSDQQLNFLRSLDPEDWEEQHRLLNVHQCYYEIASPNSWAPIPVADPRKNVRLNGTLQIPQRRLGQDGTWHWTMETGDVLSYDLKLS